MPHSTEEAAQRAERWKALAERRKFTPTEDNVVVGMSSFYSLRQIGEHLGRSISSIQSACRRLGVRTNGGTGGRPMHRHDAPTEENV